MATNLSCSSVPSHNEQLPDVTYVALATTLLPAELQVHASAAGLCFLQVVDYATNAERLFVRVAALPHRLDDLQSSRVFTLCLSREQLAHALPWDREMQARPTGDVRELVTCPSQHVSPQGGDAEPFAHTLPFQSPFPSQNEHHSDDGTVRPQPHEQDETTTLIPLPEVFISTQTITETVAEAVEPPLTSSSSRRTSWMRLTWLHAALAMVRRQMSHACQAFAKLDILLEKVIAAQGRLHQSLVSASAVYVGARLVGWRLQIALPLREVVA